MLFPAIILLIVLSFMAFAAYDTAISKEIAKTAKTVLLMLVGTTCILLVLSFLKE